MYKSCSKCGKIHDSNYRCNKSRIYAQDHTRELRNTYDWIKKSLEIRERSNYLCEVCKQENIYTYDNLEVHHIVKINEDDTRLLDNYNLVCLCQEHHKKADRGEIDKEYLFKLAKIREDGTDT